MERERGREGECESEGREQGRPPEREGGRERRNRTRGRKRHHICYYQQRETETFTAPNIPRKCPLVLLVKIAWNQGKTLGSKEERAVVSRLLGVCSRKQWLRVCAKFCIWWAST
jgi:hypothetical protein